MCARVCVMCMWECVYSSLSVSPAVSPPVGQHLSMHFDAFHHQVSDLPPALPARSLRKVPCSSSTCSLSSSFFSLSFSASSSSCLSPSSSYSSTRKSLYPQKRYFPIFFCPLVPSLNVICSHHYLMTPQLLRINRCRNK